MSETENMLTEILLGQDNPFFYAHRNTSTSAPFEGLDGKTYDIDLEEVAAIKHDEDEGFEIDESKAWSFEDEAGDSFRFFDNDDGTCTLVSCANAGEEVSVPAVVGGKTVSAIAFFAFAECKGLKSLICPPDVTRIHANAFKNCNALEKLVLPRKSRSINRAWFKTLKQLRYLVLPDDLESVSGKAFVSIELDYLYIGANTRDIEPGAFNFSKIGHLEISPENTALSTDGECIYSCDGTMLLTYYGSGEHYSIPVGCREVSSNAFAYNKTLRSVGMPDSLEIIGTYAFSNSLLEEFAAPKNLREIREKAFYFCSRMSRVILNDGLLFIGKEAFFKAPIEELYIPASVAQIEQHAFYNTDASMAELGLGSASADAEGAGADADAGTPFGIRMSPESPRFFIDEQGGLYEHADQGLVFLEMLSLKAREYAVDSETAEVAPGAFLRHPYIETVHLPDGLRAIGDSAFRGCKSLITVNFPETLESIGKEAFVETIIQEAYISHGLSYLGEMALRSSGKGFTHWLPGLKELEIHPDNHRFFIEDGVLYQRIDGEGEGERERPRDAGEHDNGIPVYGVPNETRALQYIGPNENVRIPHGCTAIMPYAFAGISAVRKIYLPSSLQHISYSGLMFEDAPEEVTIELAEPNDGRSSVTAYFSREGLSNQNIRKALAPARLNIPDIFMYSDQAIAHTHNFYIRAKLALQRLMDPVYCTPDNIDIFQSIFRKELPRACREFAHNDFAKGFDYLIKLGYIDESNMTKIIDEVSETNDVAMIGYLLELKHRHFAKSISLDLDL